MNLICMTHSWWPKMTKKQTGWDRTGSLFWVTRLLINGAGMWIRAASCQVTRDSILRSLSPCGHLLLRSRESAPTCLWRSLVLSCGRVFFLNSCVCVCISDFNARLSPCLKRDPFLFPTVCTKLASPQLRGSLRSPTPIPS